MTQRVYNLCVILVVALAATILTGADIVLAQESHPQPAQPPVSSSRVKPVIVDDFEAGTITNSLGSKTNVYIKAPSKAMVTFRKDVKAGKPTSVLMIRYDKKAEGGPNDMGGWCGYYTLLKKLHPSVTVEGATPAEVEEDVYFDASNYSAIALWVKGDKGGENFVLGVADAHWDKIGDSVKSQEIGKYLPAGKITTEWQKAIIPLDEFFIDYAKLSSVTICFEGDCFPEGKGTGKIYVDDIQLEQ